MFYTTPKSHHTTIAHVHDHSECTDDPKSCRHFFRDASNPDAPPVVLNSYQVMDELNPGVIGGLRDSKGVPHDQLRAYIRERCAALGKDFQDSEIDIKRWHFHAWGARTEAEFTFPHLVR